MIENIQTQNETKSSKPVQKSNKSYSKEYSKSKELKSFSKSKNKKVKLINENQETEDFKMGTNFRAQKSNYNNMYMKNGAPRLEKSPTYLQKAQAKNQYALSPNVYKKSANVPKQKSISRKGSSKNTNFSDNIKDVRTKELLSLKDHDLPSNALNCLTKRFIVIKNGKRIKTTQKIFNMKDGTQEVHEDVYVERF